MQNLIANPRLAEQINTAYAAANKNASTAKLLAAQAIEQAIRCGQLLIEAKGKLEHGQWWEWLTLNCPEISRTTAVRYMALASKSSHVSFLSDCKSMTCAYIAAGILPAPVEKDENAEPNIKLRMPYIANLADAYQAIARVRKEWSGINPNELSGTVRAVLKSEKDALSTLRDEIGSLLDLIEGL